MNPAPSTEPEIKPPPVVLSIAGSDCSAGAGIQADLKTFAYFQTHGLTAVTSIVAESPGKVISTEAVSPDILRAQLKILAESFDIKGIKTGMLANAELSEIVINFLEDLDTVAPIIVDPVLISSSGTPLLDPDAIDLYRQRLLPLATLATPNLDEAANLLDLPPISSHEDMDTAARKFTGQYQCMTLLKGGHLEGSDSTDVLWDGTSIHDFTAARVRHKTPHGTGCTYSAAITALLAHDYPLLETIESAKDYITAAISQSEVLSNSEIDTLNHFPIGID